MLRKPLVLSFTAMLAAGVPATAQTPLSATERGARQEWISHQAWGGGARFLFDLSELGPGDSNLNYLGGGAPQFVLGCTDDDPQRSRWRFRVDFTPAGSGITGEDERLAARGVAYYFGAPGDLILIDEMDGEMGRLPLRRAVDGGGLETAPLSHAEVRRFFDASAIRVATPRLRLESGMIGLLTTVRAMRQTPCGVLD
jgi:hypothetical protein